jgi:hypothetical protein
MGKLDSKVVFITGVLVDEAIPHSEAGRGKWPTWLTGGSPQPEPLSCGAPNAQPGTAQAAGGRPGLLLSDDRGPHVSTTPDTALVCNAVNMAMGDRSFFQCAQLSQGTRAGTVELSHGSVELSHETETTRAPVPRTVRRRSCCTRCRASLPAVEFGDEVLAGDGCGLRRGIRGGRRWRRS